ncbi:MAG: hypothetical protein E7387_02925 [Ruminococcaceae bacterium]|nr:hypothetical protein [Oscillospiraceae bacterium]
MAEDNININTDTDVQSNYAILGISENADKERVEKKYAMLIKQYKHKTDEYGTTNEDLAYYNKITKAYNEIMGIKDDYSDMDPTNIIPYSIRKRFQKFSATIENYKMLICGILLFCVIIILTVLQVKDSFKDDISIKFVGAFASGYSTSEDGYIDVQIKDKSEVVDAPIVSFFTVVEGETSLLDSTAKNAAVQFRTEFTTGALDVIIIDKENLEIYIKQLVFLKLDDFLEEHKNDTGFENLNVFNYENSGEEDDYAESGIYAVEITDTSFFEGMNLEKRYPEERQTMYLAIARTSKRPDIAKAFAAEIISANK